MTDLEKVSYGEPQQPKQQFGATVQAFTQNIHKLQEKIFRKKTRVGHLEV